MMAVNKKYFKQITLLTFKKKGKFKIETVLEVQFRVYIQVLTKFSLYLFGWADGWQTNKNIV